MKHTIQEAFEQFENKYLELYKPSYIQKKVFNNITACKTEKLGTRIYECLSCGHRVFSYNSCISSPVL